MSKRRSNQPESGSEMVDYSDMLAREWRESAVIRPDPQTVLADAAIQVEWQQDPVRTTEHNQGDNK